VGLLPYSPLARGFLAGNRNRDGALTQRARTDKLADGLYRDCDFDVLDAVLKIAQARGVTPMQVALAWLIAQPVVGAPVFGVSSPDQITDAAAATDLLLTSEEITSMQTAYQPRAI
jgi:aryl-alcohol dehydrogenase (NADP+)